MATVSAVNASEVSPLLNLPMNEGGPLERILSYVGPQGLGALFFVCKQIQSMVVDAGKDSRGGRLWRDAIEAEMVKLLEQNPTESSGIEHRVRNVNPRLAAYLKPNRVVPQDRKRWSVIDQSVWKASPALSAFLKRNGLEAPDRVGPTCYKTMLPGLEALNTLEIEGSAGTTFIAMPKGITFRMLGDLLAGAMDKPTCFARLDHVFPETYWDISVKEAYAFGITNSVIANSKDVVLEKRVELIAKKKCEVIDGINYLALLTLTYVITKERSVSGRGVRLYPCVPSTLTCVRINDLVFEMGDFLQSGVCVFFGGRSAGNGAGAQRTFGLLS